MLKDLIYLQKSDHTSYPKSPPFHPDRDYPEYKFKEISIEKNFVYDSVRKIFKLMDLDKKNWNKENWNPLDEIISPGDCVFIKPNLVIDNFRFQNSLTTHPSIIRTVTDYVIYALKGEGEIIIGDAPLQDCNFQNLVRSNGLSEIIHFFKSKGIKIELIDLRTEMLDLGYHKKKSKISLKGDPKGYSIINLGHDSNLHNISFNKRYQKFRVTKYDPNVMKAVHNNLNHKYLISNSVLKSNVVIQIPKIKTHRKAGFTCCLKNTIGINCKKDMLPHHRKGSLDKGGDEYLYSNLLKSLINYLNELEDKYLIKHKFLYKFYFYPLFLVKMALKLCLSFSDKDNFFEGSWYGNDTLWRTIADLNQILFYADKSGNMTSKINRKLFYICDGFVCGEGEGPLKPSPKEIGILLGGYDPLLLDLGIAELLKFNFKKIPQISRLFHLKKREISQFKPENLIFISNIDYWNNKSLNEIENTIELNPPEGWRNHIEK